MHIELKHSLNKPSDEPGVQLSIDGKPTRLIQNLTISADVKSQVPEVYLGLIPESLRLDVNDVEVITDLQLLAKRLHGLSQHLEHIFSAGDVSEAIDPSSGRVQLALACASLLNRLSLPFAYQKVVPDMVADMLARSDRGLATTHAAMRLGKRTILVHNLEWYCGDLRVEFSTADWRPTFIDGPGTATAMYDDCSWVRFEGCSVLEEGTRDPASSIRRIKLQYQSCSYGRSDELGRAPEPTA
jgi:hypothetical protein